METHFKSSMNKKVKKSIKLNLRFLHLTSTATPFKHMNFIRNGNKRSSIEIKNKGIAVINYQEWLNVILTLLFGVLMQKLKILIFRLI
jgi:hypothetical protein